MFNPDVTVANTPVTITPAERAKLARIQKLVLSGKARTVSAADRQWVLDIVKREQVMIRADVVQRAANEGLDVNGIFTI